MAENPDRADYPAAEEMWVCDCGRAVENDRDCPDCGPPLCGECGQMECGCDALDEIDENGELL